MSSSTTALASINGSPNLPASLTIETEQITIESCTATRPDLRWERVDRAGHFHAYSSDGTLPTLEARDEQMPCPGGCDDPGCDGYTVTHYQCVICGEEIEPERVPDSGPKTFPGPTFWTVEVEQRATAQIEPSGVMVSIRVSHDGQEMFGAATRGEWQAMSGGPAGVRLRTTYHGVTPLGRRKAAR